MKALNSKTFLLNEGLEDRAEIVAGRAAMAARKENVYDIEKEKKFKARRKADRIGLAYWPALLDDHGVDPMAFVYAEEVLFHQHLPWGTRVGDVMSHGGWDMQGHYGITGDAVSRAWLLSGCRDSAKFRWMIRNWNVEGWGHGWPVRVQKAHSVDDLVRMARGARHIRLHALGDPDVFAGKTLRLLGRVSGRCREALLTAIEQTLDAKRGRRGTWKIRIRDLNLDQVRALQEAPPTHKQLWDSVRTREWNARAAGPSLPLTPEVIAPGFPGADLPAALALSRGMKPVELLPGADRAEAHRALTDPTFLDRGLTQWMAQDQGHGVWVRSVAVSRWLGQLHRAGRWGQMTRIRTARGPAGAVRQYTYLDIIDEVDDDDIVGLKDKAEDVFARAAARLEADMAAQAAEDAVALVEAPSWAVGHAGVTPLLSKLQLRTEGQEQHHCVSGYWQSTARRQSICLSLVTAQGRTTAEVSWDGKTVFQHKGVRNATPPDANNKLLEELLVAARTRHAS